METNNLLNPLEVAFKRKEQERLASQNKGSYSGDIEYEKISWFGLQQNADRVFRLLGNPWECNTKGSDMTLILRSKIVSDHDKYFYVNWRWIIDPKTSKPIPDPNWFLTRFYDSVRKFEWKKRTKDEMDSGVRGQRIFKHDTSESFKRIEHNKTSSDKGAFENNFYPRKLVMINVLDRHDGWCVENKHSKSIAARYDVKPKLDGSNEVIEFVNVPGLPLTLYDQIIELSRSGNGTLDFDISVKLIGQDYYVNHFGDFKVPKAIRELCNGEPVTDLEKSYELYDFSKLYPVTSYSKIKKNLIGAIKQWDKEQGFSFSDELEELVSKELEQIQNNKQESETSTGSVVAKVVVANTAPVRERVQVTEVVGEYDLSDLESKFPHLSSIPDDSRESFLENIQDFKNGNIIKKPVYNNGKEIAWIPCKRDCQKSTKCDLPSTVFNCPACGDEL